MPRWMTWVTNRLRPISLSNTAEKTVQVGVVQGNMTVVNVIQCGSCISNQCDLCRDCGHRIVNHEIIQSKRAAAAKFKKNGSAA